MKKLFYLLLFTTATIYAQQTTVIHKELEPFVLEFVSEAKKRNIDGVAIILNIKEIIYVNDISVFPVPHNTVALYDTKNKSIYLDIRVKNYNYKAKRLIIFHEIGHSLGLNDGKGIMSTNIEYKEFKSIIRNWEKEVDKLLGYEKNI